MFLCVCVWVWMYNVCTVNGNQKRVLDISLRSEIIDVCEKFCLLPEFYNQHSCLHDCSTNIQPQSHLFSILDDYFYYEYVLDFTNDFMNRIVFSHWIIDKLECISTLNILIQ